MAGTFQGEVLIDTNDQDEDPFRFDLTGTIVDGIATIIDNADAGPGFVAGGFTAFTELGNASGGYNETVHSSLPGGGSTAVWTFSGLTAGGVYDVAVTWPGSTTYAANAPYAVSGTAADQPVRINQQQAPDSFDAADFSWERL